MRASPARSRRRWPRRAATALVKAVYETKVANGETILTHIHHRQSPLYLMQGRGAGGRHLAVGGDVPGKGGPSDRACRYSGRPERTAIYAGAVVKGAPHPEAAKMWLEFIRSPAALAIFESYGFKPYKDGAN